MKNNILEQHIHQFGRPQVYVQAPGRANIIGEHTDYNKGLVLPFAIEQSIHMFISKNKTHELRLFATDLKEYFEVDFRNLSITSEGWARYFINSLVVLQKTQGIGIDVTFGGDLPGGAGLSSSSAITCGFMAGINCILNLNYNISELIDLASQAENGIGLKGGTMDQTIIMEGQAHHALCIDYLDVSMQSIPLQNNSYRFYIFDSGQKHNLLETEYNDRRATCEKALRLLKKEKSSIKSFRDVSIHDIETLLLDTKSKKRCRHVVTENQRVLDAIDAIEKKNYPKLGRLMQESHLSLSHDYEVSTSEIDFLVQLTLKLPKVLGGRIMGGGFGGSTINLVNDKLTPSEISRLKEAYTEKTSFDLGVFIIKPSDGLKVEQFKKGLS